MRVFWYSISINFALHGATFFQALEKWQSLVIISRKYKTNDGHATLSLQKKNAGTTAESYRFIWEIFTLEIELKRKFTYCDFIIGFIGSKAMPARVNASGFIELHQNRGNLYYAENSRTLRFTMFKQLSFCPEIRFLPWDPQLHSHFRGTGADAS